MNLVPVRGLEHAQVVPTRGNDLEPDGLAAESNPALTEMAGPPVALNWLVKFGPAMMNSGMRLSASPAVIHAAGESTMSCCSVTSTVRAVSYCTPSIPRITSRAASG